MKKPALLCLTLYLMLTFNIAAHASTLYLNYGDGNSLPGNDYFAVDTITGKTLNSWAVEPSHTRNYPIAVYGDIRTTGHVGGETGGLFDLNGVYLGTDYTLTGISAPNELSDGTTDGINNYAVAFKNGNVYQFDRNWSSPTLLFNAGVSGGITYDPSDETFWLSGDRNSNTGIRHYHKDGSPLGSFATPEVGSMDWNLALDPSDGTLWVGTNTTATLHNYDKSGGYQGSLTLSGIPSGSFYSDEFHLKTVVHIPAAVYLFGSGLLVLIGVSRRKKSS